MSVARTPRNRKSPQDSHQIDSVESLDRGNLKHLPVWSTGLQSKLKIGAPDDSYEREADRVADQIMRMPQKAGGQTTQASPSVVEAPLSVYQTLQQPGKPLDPATREFMESRFGHDFSNVRVHTNPLAAKSAQDMNATAYTVGQNVVFGNGEFVPRTRAGKQILAHELTHVVQQLYTNDLAMLQMRGKGGQTPMSKLLPWSRRDLAIWLQAELTDVTKKIDECDTPLTFRSYCKKRFEFEIENAKGRYRLGMQLLRMLAAGHTNPPSGSVAWEALNNPDKKSSRDLLSRVYRLARSQMFGPGSDWADAAGSGEGKRTVQERHEERLKKDPYYRHTWGNPHPDDKKYADNAERTIIDKEGRIPELATEPEPELKTEPEQPRAPLHRRKKRRRRKRRRKRAPSINQPRDDRHESLQEFLDRRADSYFQHVTQKVEEFYEPIMLKRKSKKSAKESRLNSAQIVDEVNDRVRKALKKVPTKEAAQAQVYWLGLFEFKLHEVDIFGWAGHPLFDEQDWSEVKAIEDYLHRYALNRFGFQLDMMAAMNIELPDGLEVLEYVRRYRKGRSEGEVK